MPGLSAEGVPLSALGGGEGRGKVGDAAAAGGAHLTLPPLRDGHLSPPPVGRRGAALLQVRAHNSAVARRAPSANAANFAQTTVG
jgi:hypothetical protein